jgi:hypothetical protein
MKTTKRILASLLTLGVVVPALCQEANQAQTSTKTKQTTTQPAATAQPTLVAKAAPAEAAPAQTAPATPPPTATPAPAEEEGFKFNKGEWLLSPFGAYVDQAGGKWGAGLAATYYITDMIGIGGATYWTETGGTFFDNAEFEGYFRIPLFKRIAPYGLASIGYQFDRDYWFETIGVGADFRLFKRLDAFGDFQWRIADSSHSGNGAFLRLGVRFKL